MLKKLKKEFNTITPFQYQMMRKKNIKKNKRLSIKKVMISSMSKLKAFIKSLEIFLIKKHKVEKLLSKKMMKKLRRSKVNGRLLASSRSTYLHMLY